MTLTTTQKRRYVPEILFGFLVVVFLFSFYFGIHSMTASMAHTLHQLRTYWPFMTLLAIGFGLEVGLYTYVVREMKRRRDAAAMVTTTGLISAGSMIACCAPRLVDTAPLLALSPLATFLSDYMLFFLVLGIVLNIVGIVIILRMIQRYSLYSSTQQFFTSIFKFNMGKVLKITSGISVLVLLGTFLPMTLGTNNAGAAYRVTEQLQPNTRQGIITFTIDIDKPADAGTCKLWLPYVTSNQYQLVEDVKIEGNYDDTGIYKEPENGNIILYAEWDKQGVQPHLSYSFKVTRQEILMNNFPVDEAPIPYDLMDKYLTPVSIEPLATQVRTAAEGITQGKRTVLAKAQAIYDYIVDNGERNPDIQGCGIGDLNQLLKNVSGKCVDISTLFVALARSVGVPAREVFGTRIAKEGDISGAYHCRAEFYLPGYGWVPADPSDVLKLRLVKNLSLDDPATVTARKYLFGAQSETYIDFYTGRDITLVPQASGGTLTYFMYPYAEADGKPLEFVNPGQPVYQDGLNYTVTYQEITGSTPRALPW